MPIKNWGGGGDYSDTFLALQEEFLRTAQAAADRALADARRSSSGGSGGGGGGRGGSSRATGRMVSEGADAITGGILRKQTNWTELYDFYTVQQKNFRQGSNEWYAIQIRLDSIRAIAESQGVTFTPDGKPEISSAAEAAPSIGLIGKKTAYTQDVEDYINENTLYLMTVHNGGHPNTARPVGSSLVYGLMDGTVEELLASAKADAIMQEDILRDLMAGRTVYDQITGLPIEPTPENILNVIYQGDETQMWIFGMTRGMGNHVETAKRADYLTDWGDLASRAVTEIVFPVHNSDGSLMFPDVDGAEGYATHVKNDFNNMVAIALSSEDPTVARKFLQRAGSILVKGKKTFDQFSATWESGLEMSADLISEVAWMGDLGSLLSNMHNLTPEEFLNETNLLGENRPSGFMTQGQWDILQGDYDARVRDEATDEQASNGLGNRPVPGWFGGAGILAAEAGLATTEAVKRGEYDPNDPMGSLVAGDEYIWVSKFGQTAPVPMRKSAALEYLGVEDGISFEDAFAPFTEMRGGQRVTVFREVKRYADVKDAEWYFRTERKYVDGRYQDVDVWMTPDQRAQYGNSSQRINDDGWEIKELTDVADIRVTMGEDDTLWYESPDRAGWTLQIPIEFDDNGFPPDPDMPISMYIDEDGTPRFGFYPAVEGFHMIPGVGVPLNLAQEDLELLAASGQYDFSTKTQYDENGRPTLEVGLWENGGIYENLWSKQQEAEEWSARNRSRVTDATPWNVRAQRERAQIAAVQGHKRNGVLSLYRQQNADRYNTPLQEDVLREEQQVSDNAIQIAAKMANITFGRATDQGAERFVRGLTADPNTGRPSIAQVNAQVEAEKTAPVTVEEVTQPRIRPGVDDTPGDYVKPKKPKAPPSPYGKKPPKGSGGAKVI